MLLSVENLNVYYGAIHALQGISFHVEEGEIVTLIGANGAGKSTTLRTISGLLHPRGGSIRFKGQDITAASAERIVELGISQVPEGRKIFAPLTVRENLMMGAYTRTDAQAVQKSLERVFQSFPRLKERIGQLGGTLSGGEQQMLATGRGLMSGPTLLLLDEPSMGLSPILVEEIFKIIKEINSAGHQHPAGGAERPHGAVRGQPGLRAGDRADRAVRGGPGDRRKPAGQGSLPGRLAGASRAPARIPALPPPPAETRADPAPAPPPRGGPGGTGP